MLHFSEGKNIVSHCESFQNRILTPLGCTLHAKRLFRTVSTLNTLAMHELRSERVERFAVSNFQEDASSSFARNIVLRWWGVIPFRTIHAGLIKAIDEL